MFPFVRLKFASNQTISEYDLVSAKEGLIESEEGVTYSEEQERERKVLMNEGDGKILKYVWLLYWYLLLYWNQKLTEEAEVLCGAKLTR